MLNFQGVTSTWWFCSETCIIRILPESLRMSYQRDPVSPSRMLHSWSHSANLESRNTQRIPMFFHLLPIVSQGLQKEWYGSRVWEEITLGIGSPWNFPIGIGMFCSFLISFWWKQIMKAGVLFSFSGLCFWLIHKPEKPWCFFASKFWDPPCSNRQPQQRLRGRVVCYPEV